MRILQKFSEDRFAKYLRATISTEAVFLYKVDVCEAW